MGSDDRLINYLALVRDRQTVLLRQFTELFMVKAHNYWMITIIKRSRALSTEISRHLVEGGRLLDETVAQLPRPASGPNEQRLLHLEIDPLSNNAGGVKQFPSTQ